MKSVPILFFICLLLSCSGTETPKENARQSYEVTKKALLEKEQKNPVMFLQINGSSKKNFVGQTVVRGKISNSATVAPYKDIRIKLEFYSQTKTLLETDDETVYMELYPGETQKFKTKYFAPKGTDSVALSISGAKPMVQ